jgi:4-hydroxy-4-methyl-2-oxoglutarate aldolase
MSRTLAGRSSPGSEEGLAIMHIINWNVDRPERELILGFREIAAAVISDAMGRQNSMNHTMKPLWHGAAVCGPALTVKSYACDNLMVHKAMQVAKPGDVLVVQGGGHLDGALWGELMTKSALALEIGGVVMDAAARDRDAIEALAFPVFATAVLPGGTYKSNPGSINVPVSVAGAAVEPGDIVVGDTDGVVVVPKGMAREVLEAAQRVVAREAEFTERIGRGELLLDIFDLQRLLERPDVRELREDTPPGER